MDFDFISIASAAEETVHATESNGGVAGMFGISWKLFIAQLVNFTIVLLVLWKWVLGPVTRGLQQRTKRIEESLKTAEHVQKEKLNFEQWKKQELSRARGEAAAIVVQAKTEAESARQELLALAKAQEASIVEEGRQKLEAEKVRMLAEARGQLAELVVGATEKVLQQKLTDKKDMELAKKALSQVGSQI